MNNNAFAQVRRPFFRSPRPTKTRRCELASARTLSPPPESAAEAADGGAPASSGGTSPRSPPDEGETPRGRSKATGGSPVGDAATRRVGGSGARETLSPPLESAAEVAGGGAHASSGGTSPHSPPGEGETPRGQLAHNPKNRRVDCRGESKFPRVPAPASGAAIAPPGRRPSAGRAGKSWRNHIEPERIFARGNGRMRPRSGRFERGHGRLSALGGEKQHPLRAPGQVGGAAQTNQCRHLEKLT